MSRPLRIQAPNAWYHVMNCGAGKKNIFINDQQNMIFLDWLAATSKRFQIEIHAYCLMGNHYHLLIKTPHANLSRAMRHIDGCYTQAFNRNTHTDGPLFRGRYKAILIEAEEYLLQVSRYIHLNPVEANIVTKPEHYFWSSYKYFVNPKATPLWLHTEETLERFATKKPRLCYQKFVEDGLDDDTKQFYSSKNISSIFASISYKKEIIDSLNSKIMPDVHGNFIKIKEFPSIEAIVNISASICSIRPIELLTQKNFQTTRIRKTVIYLCSEYSNAKLKEIAHWFGYSNCGSISKINHEVKTLLAEDSNTRELISLIIHKIKTVIQVKPTASAVVSTSFLSP